jgi:3-phosphoshikimate 1-carboxyvinyltransferase
MKAIIEKSEIVGKVNAPPSKSYTIRGLMAAALARGQSQIVDPLSSDDTDAAADVLSQVGVGILKKDDVWQVTGGDFHPPAADLFCRDSAATLRFMTAISSLVPGRCRLVPGPSLARRPIKPLLEALARLGVDCHAEGASVVVNGGRLKGGDTGLAGDVSSQFVSALLFIAPRAEAGVRIRLDSPPQSKPYLEMTLDCLKKFGIAVNAPADLDEFEVAGQQYQPTSYRVEGDWSSASYLLALGAVSGQVEIRNLNRDSLQGDRIMLNLLQEMGARVIVTDNKIMVNKSKLTAITADLSHCIDLLPTLAVLAAVAEGRSRFTGIGRARLKESDRVLAIREGLEAMGIAVTEEENRLDITGSVPKSAAIDSHNDHRIAMAFSILGAHTGGVTINGARSVAKTYPGFWDTFTALGGKVELNVK